MKAPLTKEEIQAKAEELKSLHKCEIIPLVFVIPETQEQVVGYLKEVPRIVKIRAVDKAMVSPVSAGAELLEIALIKEASDERILSEAPEHDSIFIGAAWECYNSISISINQFKKKSMTTQSTPAA